MKQLDLSLLEAELEADRFYRRAYEQGGRIVVTGSRAATRVHRRLMESELEAMDLCRFHIAHGGQGRREGTGCVISGADMLFDELARARGHRIEVYNAEWTRYGLAAGPIRNELMLDSFKPQAVLSFWDGSSPGCEGCMRLARARGIPVRVVSIQ